MLERSVAILFPLIFIESSRWWDACSSDIPARSAAVVTDFRAHPFNLAPNLFHKAPPSLYFDAIESEFVGFVFDCGDGVEEVADVGGEGGEVRFEIGAGLREFRVGGGGGAGGGEGADAEVGGEEGTGLREREEDVAGRKVSRECGGEEG